MLAARIQRRTLSPVRSHALLGCSESPKNTDMNLDEAKANIGQMVMAADSKKLIKGPHKPHGPYLLLRVTKGGMCELERDENHHGTRFVKPTLISLPNSQDRAREA